MPHVFSPEVRTGPEGEDVWRGATPTEAVPSAPYQDKRAPLAAVLPAVDWCEVLRFQSALFTCRQEQAAGCIVLLQVFHAWMLLPDALQPSAHPLTLTPFHTSRVLGWTGTRLEVPRSLVSSFLAPSSATPTKILCPCAHEVGASVVDAACPAPLAYSPPPTHICLFTPPRVLIWSVGFWKQKREKNSNMSINNTQPFPLISLTSWIIHSQLELRGRSRPTAQVHFQWFIYWAKQGISKLLFTAHYPTACYFYAIVITPGSSRSAAEVKSIKGSWEPFSRHTPRSVSSSELGCTGTTNLSRSQVSRNETLQVTQVGRYEAH